MYELSLLCPQERVEVIEEIIVTKKPEEKKTDDTVLPQEVTDALKVDTGVVKVGDDLTDLLGGLGKLLGGVTDAKTAEEVIPKLKEFAPTLESIQKGTDGLPAEGKSTIAKIVTDNLGKLQAVIDTVMAIPGVKDLLGPVVTPMVETLSKLGK